MNKEVVRILVENDFLVEPDLEIKEEHLYDFLSYLRSLEEKPLVITKQIYREFLRQRFRKVEEEGKKEGVKVLKSFSRDDLEKLSIESWFSYYYDRFNRIKQMLAKRIPAISIKNLKGKRGKLSTIAMVRSIRRSRSGNLILEVEDPTGSLRAIVGKESDCYRDAEELICDEVIGLNLELGKRWAVVDSIFFPDVQKAERGRADRDVKAVFIADMHIGSKMFLKNKWEAFLHWLKRSDIEYVFIVGDLVDGVGVYPEQERELEIKDIYEQYEKVAEYLSMLDDKTIIICPGNHDATIKAEPQIPIFKEYAKELYEMKNVYMLSNPCMVEVEGVKVLLYHGYSFDTLIAENDYLKKHKYDGFKLMRFLLRKRHLAPLHGSTLALPLSRDWLVLDEVPDIFAAAHIHRPSIGVYRGVLNICCSCFQAKTVFQEKVGHEPVPGIAIVVNLRTWETKQVKF